ncbi:hypothetical protein P7C73_g5679, partial [Tremellales sp. Uapishka_1]
MALLRPAFASGSRLPLLSRSFVASARRPNILAELDKQLNPREIIEQKRKAFEEKYGDKLKRKMEAEGVQDLDELKVKKLVPSVKESLKAKPKLATVSSAKSKLPALKKEKAYSQAEADRSGIKPLASILNLPLLHLTPHDANAINQIWTSYHTLHPSLSSSYLSASIPAYTYDSITTLAKENPSFVLPLPRDTPDADKGAYEMFYLQWLFHPTPSSPVDAGPLPPTTTVIFTPLEEFKTQGEWAQPYLVLTHYPDLSSSHNTVLMRGEISPAEAKGPEGSLANPGYLLSQQQAQLLALALQRFYCSDIVVVNEGDKGREERIKRQDALRGFRERPQEWDWKPLVGMAYAGLA